MNSMQIYGVANPQLSSNVSRNNELKTSKQISFKGRNLKQLLPNKASRETIKLSIFGPIVQKFADFVQMHPRLAKIVSKFIK